MGADLTLTYMRAPHAKGEKEVPFERWRAVGHERINSAPLTDAAIERLLEDYNLEESELAAEIQPDLTEELTEEQRVRLCRDHLHDAFDRLTKDALYRRDVSTLTIGGKRYWFTGGLSWGDPATDAYDWIASLDIIGLFDLPILPHEL